jgi:hypothetical protein
MRSTLSLKSVYSLNAVSKPKTIETEPEPHRGLDVRNFTRTGIVDWTPKLHVVRGTIWRDFLWTSALILVVHERVCDVWRSNDFTGWATYMVHVFDRHGDQVEGYVGVSVKGRSGPMDVSGSNVRWQTYSNGGRYVSEMKGLIFNPGTWDGSDFFMLEENAGTGIYPGDILIIKRVVEAMKKAKLTGFEAIPISRLSV